MDVFSKRSGGGKYGLPAAASSRGPEGGPSRSGAQPWSSRQTCAQWRHREKDALIAALGLDMEGRKYALRF